MRPETFSFCPLPIQFSNLHLSLYSDHEDHSYEDHNSRESTLLMDTSVLRQFVLIFTAHLTFLQCHRSLLTREITVHRVIMAP